MVIDDLIEKLYELKREFGEQEVELLTQKDAWFWDEHDIGEVYLSEDGKIVIQGKGENRERRMKYYKISEDKMISALDFVEMFDSAFEDIAEVLTKDSEKFVIRKYSMFPENMFLIDFGEGYYGQYPKVGIANFLSNAGIQSYTLKKMGCR